MGKGEEGVRSAGSTEGVGGGGSKRGAAFA